MALVGAVVCQLPVFFPLFAVFFCGIRLLLQAALNSLVCGYVAFSATTASGDQCGSGDDNNSFQAGKLHESDSFSTRPHHTTTDCVKAKAERGSQLVAVLLECPLGLIQLLHRPCIPGIAEMLLDLCAVAPRSRQLVHYPRKSAHPVEIHLVRLVHG